MTTSLNDLLAVQDLDLALDQLRHRRSHLPEREEMSRLAAEATRLRAELAAVEAARAELAERQARSESDLSAVETRSASINQRLYAGGVSASKDLQAMSAELDQLKTRASALEDSVLEVLEALEPLDGRAAELDRALRDLAAEEAGTVERLAAAEEAIDEEIATATAGRREAASRVPDGLLSTYDGLRARLGGVGAARLVGNHCDGCHLTLSAVELDRVRHLPEGEIFTCEQCSRILVP